MRNVFADKSDQDLLKLYEQDLRFKKKGFLDDNYEELAEILFMYHDKYDSHGIALMENDLYSEIALRWRNIVKDKED